MIPLFVYSLPCACLRLADITLLQKLKTLYKNSSVLFCLNDLTHCPYERRFGGSRVDGTTNAFEFDSQHISCSSSSSSTAGMSTTATSVSLLPAIHEKDFTKKSLDRVKINALNALTTEHCDLYTKGDQLKQIDDIKQLIVNDTIPLDCSFPPKSSKILSQSCSSNPVQLQRELEALEFSFIPFPKDSKDTTVEQATDLTERQSKSLIYRFNDRSKTIRISISYYLKKVLQSHITKAAKDLNRLAVMTSFSCFFSCCWQLHVASTVHAYHLTPTFSRF